VFHYTTSDGLKSILVGRTLWATDLAYLNDASEYIYADTVFDKVFSALDIRSFLLEARVEAENGALGRICYEEAKQEDLVGRLIREYWPTSTKELRPRSEQPLRFSDCERSDICAK
jgi:hypothetical protein